MQTNAMGGMLVMILGPDTGYCLAILSGFDAGELPAAMHQLIGTEAQFIHGHGLGLYVSESPIAGSPNYLGSVLADEALGIETSELYGRVILTGVDDGAPTGLTLREAADLEDHVQEGRRALEIVMAGIRQPADDEEAAAIQRYTQRDTD